MWLMDCICEVVAELINDFPDLLMILGSGCFTYESFDAVAQSVFLSPSRRLDRMGVLKSSLFPLIVELIL